MHMGRIYPFSAEPSVAPQLWRSKDCGFSCNSMQGSSWYKFLKKYLMNNSPISHPPLHKFRLGGYPRKTGLKNSHGHKPGIAGLFLNNKGIV